MRANLEALEVLKRCSDGDRDAAPDEQSILARWSGWGAIPQVFDESDDRFNVERQSIRSLLATERAWEQARRTTLNAHYTSASVVKRMWGLATSLGVPKTADVLEPGCGSGNFIGFAPPDMSMTGVELDATTAQIARHLYQGQARIHTGPLEEYAPGDNSFDLVIGNVPFAKITPHDPRYNRGRHALHNYFLLKSLHLTRPGGFVIALTSRYTLDARNPAARTELAELADLVGAIRLPERAFARSSGTDVVVDLLVLRRREPGMVPQTSGWNAVAPAVIDRQLRSDIEINEHFVGYPNRVLGELAASRGLYRDNELTVLPTGDLDEQLETALAALAADAHRQNLTFAAKAPLLRGVAARAEPAMGQFELTHAIEGSFVLSDRGDIAQMVNGVATAYSPRVARDRGELMALIELRDAARSVLAVQVAD